MTECKSEPLQFANTNGRKVEVNFEGKEVSSDAGVLLLKQADEKLGLLQKFADNMIDRRRVKSCDHSLLGMLRQKIFGLGLGYEDLNDHDQLRKDTGLQTAVGVDRDLASSPTLCRFENSADRSTAIAAHKAMFSVFVQSFSKPPKELILDFDPTDDRVHGNQQGRHFHGYYGHHCFLPLYVFCGDHLLVSYLRPSNIDGAKHSWAILALLVKALREVWPTVQITFRADSGFCRDQLLSWCERNRVGYIVGIGKNNRLRKLAVGTEKKAAREHYKSGERTRCFSFAKYRANSWKSKRKIIIKTERHEDGSSSRFLVTNIRGHSDHLYEDLYCLRGNMENGIKQVQLDLFSDRTSCNDWYANQFRVIASSMAYILLDAIRRIGLKDTKLARATVGTIRLKLLKVGAVISKNTRRIVLSFSSHYPDQNLFRTVTNALLE